MRDDRHLRVLPALFMPIGKPMISIRALADEDRARLAAVDEALLRMIAQRARIVEELWRRKLAWGLALEDPSQERNVLTRARRWAEEEQLDPQAVDRVFTSIMGLSKEHARRSLVRGRGSAAASLTAPEGVHLTGKG